MEKQFYLFLICLAVILLSLSIALKQKAQPVLSLSAELGQSFILGFEGTGLDQNTKNILTEIKPAGIILYYRNYKNPEQLKNLISELQIIAKETTGQPYFIMIDEEPGGASRLNVFDNVFAFGVPDWKLIESGIKSLKDVGINVDLAPIADFPFDGNSFIKDRVPAHTTESLIDFNNKFIALLKKYNISATLKHFPGMGVFVDDPHKKLPYANPEVSVIDKSLQIFKSGIDNGSDFVMTCHGVYDDIDLKNPATLSKKITTDILQTELGFSGLIITDDLSDMPFTIDKNINLADATAQAILAGNNLVIFSHKIDNTKIIFEKLLLKMKTDENLKSAIERNYIKVVSLKEKNLGY